MNRKGQLAILLLFLVTIVLVVVTLFGFATFDEDFSYNSLLVSKNLVATQFGQEYVDNRADLIAGETIRSNPADLRSEFMRVADAKDLHVEEPAMNFFGKIRNGEFYFAKEGDLYKLRIEGLFVQASYGGNSERKDFDLCRLFDEKGSYLKEMANEEDYKKSC